jgi:hypothetical protein
VADFRAGKRASRGHIRGMANTRAAIPMVEVTAPDGSKSFWAAAVAHRDAVETVKKVIPADHVAELSLRRSPFGPKLEGLRPGEVRKVKP